MSVEMSLAHMVPDTDIAKVIKKILTTLKETYPNADIRCCIPSRVYAVCA